MATASDVIPELHTFIVYAFAIDRLDLPSIPFSHALADKVLSELNGTESLTVQDVRFLPSIEARVVYELFMQYLMWCQTHASEELPAGALDGTDIHCIGRNLLRFFIARGFPYPDLLRH